MLQTVSKPLTRIRILSDRLRSLTAFITRESRKLPFCGPTRSNSASSANLTFSRSARGWAIGMIPASLSDRESGGGKIPSENPEVRRILGDRANDLLTCPLFEVDADRRVDCQKIGEITGKMLQDRRHAPGNWAPAA